MTKARASGGTGRIAGLLAGAFLLAACDGLGGAANAPRTSPAPVARAVAPSAQSLALARYYQSTQTRMLAQGLLRQDGGDGDAPFNAATLAANFERIALYNEYVLRGGRFVAQQTPSRLRRWEAPVVLQPVFGATVSPDQQARDIATLTGYAARLARISRHPIRVATSGPANYHVLFMSTDDLVASAPVLRQILPDIDSASLDGITRMPRTTFCAVYAFSDRGNPETHVAAIAVIRDEHPDLLRLSCIHEEIAQGLGLPNDSPAARPSIFNDDDEFALLTQHDALLLSMLYDPRLRPGMTPAQARPLVAQIAREKIGGGS